MTQIQRFNFVARKLWLTLLLALIAMLAGCRDTRIHVSPEQPQQGDMLWIVVDNEENDEVDYVTVTYADQTKIGYGMPAYFTLDTCKDTQPYLTRLEIDAVTTYVDGATGSEDREVDLTRGAASTEDEDLDYAVYLAGTSHDDLRDDSIDMAEAFMDEFDAYSNSQYLTAEPRFFTRQSDTYANSADLVIAWGHGNHHTINPAGETIDLSTTGYGNFRPCGGSGDAEYMVFFSCLTLSLRDDDGNGWRYYWVNRIATQSDLRPFSGLHMALGFRSEVRTRWIFGTDGADLFEEFAANLDSGDRVVDAWQEAVGDELSFLFGDNRGTVMYLQVYEDDTIFSVTDDYILGNIDYHLVADYWE